jgi:hypothetical protein
VAEIPACEGNHMMTTQSPPGQESNASTLPSIADWTSFAADLRKGSYTILAAARLQRGPRGNREIDVLAVTLLARTAQNLKGVVVLIEAGLVVEARILARSCLENALWLGGLIVDGDAFADRMLEDEMKSRQRRGSLLLDTATGDEALDNEQKLREWLDQSKAKFPKPRMLSAVDAAAGGPIKDAYLFYVQLSADAAHPSLHALNRHIEPDSGATVGDLVAAPDASEAELRETMGLACFGALLACVETNQLLTGKEDSPATAPLTAAYMSLMEREGQERARSADAEVVAG